MRHLEPSLLRNNVSETCDVIVIGAGIGGLSSGLHLVDKGYKTLILEAHTSPGGLCTSFERKGFTFDTCIHWLVGCGEGGLSGIL
jgi:phytoene dehydrogenase-like protein